MIFPITIEYHKRKIRLSVEQLYIDDRTEQYSVTGGNGSIVIESNRPLFRTKGLKHRMPNWKQVKGQNISTHTLELIAKAIQKHFEKT